MSRRPMPWCGGADGCGPGPDSLFSTRQQHTRKQLTEDAELLQFTAQERVWLSTKDLPLRTQSHKLANRFIGPFPVSSVHCMCYD